MPGDTQLSQPVAPGLFRDRTYQRIERAEYRQGGTMLRAIDAATRPEQLNLPGYYFHALRGASRWSIRVTGNWRITFGWDGADAIDVDLEDYH